MSVWGSRAREARCELRALWRRRRRVLRRRATDGFPGSRCSSALLSHSLPPCCSSNSIIYISKRRTYIPPLPPRRAPDAPPSSKHMSTGIDTGTSRRHIRPTQLGRLKKQHGRRLLLRPFLGSLPRTQPRSPCHNVSAHHRIPNLVLGGVHAITGGRASLTSGGTACGAGGSGTGSCLRKRPPACGTPVIFTANPFEPHTAETSSMSSRQ